MSTSTQPLPGEICMSVPDMALLTGALLTGALLNGAPLNGA
jgi:hypothetical protein